jgi:PhzF family phenazine biosynthesis protein
LDLARDRAGRDHELMSDSSTTLPRTVDVELVAAFTKDGAGGNPAGVVLDAAALSSADRQRVATAVGAPETAFVEHAADGAFAVEFYTPNKQVPDCGHATVATFALLAQRGKLAGTTAVKRTIIGDRAIFLEGEHVFMEQPRPAVRAFGRTAEIAAALAIPTAAIAAEPVVADHGVRFILVPVDRAALAAIVPDATALQSFTDEIDAIGFYVYAPGEGGYDATIRMFAPSYGIPEEPATGMAAGLLAGTLAQGRENAVFRFLQGALSPQPSPSELLARVDPQRVLVGGTATPLRTLRV